jgi:hypothetical protein
MKVHAYPFRLSPPRLDFGLTDLWILTLMSDPICRETFGFKSKAGCRGL